ncbi:MAG: winged helix-turn-helix domain-containing protein [Nitrososphaera sp.]
MSDSTNLDADNTNENIEILSTEDEKIKLIGNLLGNDSSRAILKLLLEKEMTANEIAQKTEQLLSLIIHHLQKMQEAGMIRITKTVKNTKGHDMKFYGPTKMVVLIFPSKASNKAKGSKSLRNSLNKIYRFAAIGMAGIISWFVLQPGNEVPVHTGVVTSEPLLGFVPILVPLMVMFVGLVVERILVAFKK